MVSAPGQNLRDNHYISALCEAPLRVTAKLNEMVQYSASVNRYELKLAFFALLRKTDVAYKILSYGSE